MRPTRPASPERAALYRWAGFWKDRTLGEYLDWAAGRFGSKIAVVDRGRRFTFHDIEHEVGRLAGALRAHGVGAGDVVSYQLPNWIEAYVAYHAAARLGAVINPIVPIYRGREVRFILGQSQSRVVMIPSTFRGFDYCDLYRRVTADQPELTVVVVGEPSGPGQHRWSDFLERGTPVAGADTTVDPDDVILLLYTSGTTSDPKGALHSHNTLLFDTQSTIDWFGLNERDVIFMPSPVTHVTGIIYGLTLPFLNGSTVVLQDVWEPEAALDLICRHQVTFMQFATPFLRGLVDAAEARGADTSFVRAVGCGGTDIPPSLVQRATRQFGVAVRMYGATEGPSATCTTAFDPVESRVATDGRWIAPTEGKIVDGDGRTLPPGEPGEILWRGPDTFLGYLDASLNDRAFDSDGFFRTGDIGVMDRDGYLTVQGRIKDIINRGGEKFSSGEIESLLIQHPKIDDVAVIGVPDERLGEKACACVVVTPGETIDLPEMLAFLSSYELARQKYPEDILVLDALPRTPAGKVQKFRLREAWTDARAIPSPVGLPLGPDGETRDAGG